jgi:hypothetical protein
MKKYISITLSVVVLILASCTGDFEELNTNPNRPVSVGAQFLLPQALQTTIDNYWGNKTRNQRLNFDHAMSWVGYISRNIYENEGDNYNVQPSVNISNWEVFYTDGLINFQKIVEIAGPDGDKYNPNYMGIGIGMKAWIFSMLSDVWGAIPYSEAARGTDAEAIFSPAYDSQETVYAGIIADLEEANSLLDASGPSVSGDILFNGNVVMWKKFFNSLRFRLLNRQAHIVTGSGAIMQAMLDDPATYPMMESNADMAALTYGSRPTNNPWHDILILQGRTDWNMSSTLVDKMSEMGDTRLSVFATPGEFAEGEILGTPNGLPGSVGSNYLGYSAIINPDNFAQETSSVILMSYAELLFLKAEAALEGDITGDPQVYFDQAVQASFDQYDATMPTGFVASLGPVSKENIITQKWVALFGQGIEAWTELRRTGFPVLPAADPRALFQNDGVLPTRLVYPSTEYSLNGANVESGAALNGGPDDMKTALWWVE